MATAGRRAPHLPGGLLSRRPRDRGALPAVRRGDRFQPGRAPHLSHGDAGRRRRPGERPGADPEAVAAPITPASAGDIGDRLILVPQQTHPLAAEDELRDLVVELAADRNVVVIVPGYRRAAFWAPYAKAVLDKDSLTLGVEQLRANPKLGLVVLVNRYDGVDLPGHACHVLVVDGLPEAMSGTERIDQAQLAGSELLIARQVQRLEQAWDARRAPTTTTAS